MSWILLRELRSPLLGVRGGRPSTLMARSLKRSLPPPKPFKFSSMTCACCVLLSAQLHLTSLFNV